MRVVLFCGGLGTRLREYSETIPKPLAHIGPRPMIWHLMKYYAHFGHKDFILCLGYRGDLIKDYFLNYNECMSNDFTMSGEGKKICLHNSDIDDWRISFVDTGLKSNIGQRLNAVKKYLEDEEMFLANYADGLSDLPLPEYIADIKASGVVAGILAVRPSQSFHTIRMGRNELVEGLNHVRETEVWINGGFFVFRKEIFQYLREGEELVEQPFYRLIAERQLASRRYEGFWASMDTLKDKNMFDDMYERGMRPWEVWNNHHRLDLTSLWIQPGVEVQRS